MPKREIFGWCCFDFANSAFTTVIITVVYAVYFQRVVAGGDARAPAWWGLALASASALVILASPLIGALADLRAAKKSFLAITAGVCSVATAALYFAGPGEVGLALVLVGVAAVAFGLSENLCAAFLPEISTPETAGRISGYGWSFGYLGGLLSLLLALLILRSGEGRVPWTFLMTGAFFLAAATPTLVLLRERSSPLPLPPGKSLLAAGWGATVDLLKELPRHRVLTVFFASQVAFMAGLTAIVAFASVYASEVIGMSQGEVIGLFVVLQLAGVAGAWGFGVIQDRIGPRASLGLSLLLWIVVCVWGAFCESKGAFYAVGGLAGVAMGALQSAGRAVVSIHTPEGRSGEFFGLWGLFGKLGGVVGQPVFGWLAAAYGFRAAVAANAVFFLLALVLVLLLRRTEAAGTEPQ